MLIILLISLDSYIHPIRLHKQEEKKEGKYKKKCRRFSTNQ